jgi:hypothetical protein
MSRLIAAGVAQLELFEPPVALNAAGAEPNQEVEMTTPTDPTTRELADALQGLDYPAPRAKLVTTALANGASPAVVRRILELPETADFVTEEELHRTLGVAVPGTHPHGWE